MTLDQLRYFVAAAKYEHIHRAAQSIPISASVISQSVKLLEEELGCKLFTRDKKQMRLTSQGLRLLDLSADLLEKADDIKQELGRANVPLSGHYRIGASHFLAARLVTPVWTSMQSHYPKLSADVHSQPTWVLVDNILAGRLDFGVGFSPTPHPQIDAEEIFQGKSEVVVRKNHPIFNQTKSQHYKLLNKYPATMHMASEKIFSARNYTDLKAAHLDGNVAFGFDSDFVALENLRNSDNWSYMLDIMVAAFEKFLSPIPIPKKTETQYSIQILKHKSRKIDPAMAEAFALIKQHVQQMKKLK